MTAVLIDTHTFLWFVEDHPRLGPTAKRFLESEAQTTYLSIVSLWELAIKLRIGKMKLPR